MTAYVLILPLAAALVCLALDRLVATRALGLACVAALLVAGLLLADGVRRGLPIELFDYVWLALGDEQIRLALRLDALGWPLALLTLWGGALAVLSAALAVPSDLRGFGGLFAALLAGLAVVVAGLASETPLLPPFAPALAGLCAALVLRASGALPGSPAPLSIALGGLLAALALLAAALLLRAGQPGAAGAALGFSLLAALLAVGAPPFHGVMSAAVAAPAPLAAILAALGLPLLGGAVLVRVAAGLGAAGGESWAGVVVTLGLLALVAGAAGALGARTLRSIIGWQLSAQLGLVICATGVGGAALAVAAPALLLNATLSTLAMLLATTAIERRAGGDDLTALGAVGRAGLPGLAFLLAAASAVGVPGTWGLWGRVWLVESLADASWALAPLLAGSTLLALTLVAPLAAFWRGAPTAAPAPTLRRATALLPLVAALPLALLGILPGAAWSAWLNPAEALLVAEPVAAPSLPGLAGQLAAAAAAAALLGLPALARGASLRRQPADPDMRSDGVLLPEGFGGATRGLAAAADPVGPAQRGWGALDALGGGLRRWLLLIERRYYLAWFLIALIVVILIFI